METQRSAEDLSKRWCISPRREVAPWIWTIPVRPNQREVAGSDRDQDCPLRMSTLVEALAPEQLRARARAERRQRKAPRLEQPSTPEEATCASSGTSEIAANGQSCSPLIPSVK